MTAKWIEAFLNLVSGEKSKCPLCGSPNLEHGYVMLDKTERVGYGAVWCKDCNHAFNLSRAKIDNYDKVLTDLPGNLVYN